jgi:hypothetical protein
MSDKSLEFSTEDVVIAEDGRVIINNPEFAKRLISHVKAVAPGRVGIFDNCDCKKALSEVNLGRVLPATKFRLDPGVVGIFDNCDCKSRVMVGDEIKR